jgi:hypothetical protein
MRGNTNGYGMRLTLKSGSYSIFGRTGIHGCRACLSGPGMATINLKPMRLQKLNPVTSEYRLEAITNWNVKALVLDVTRQYLFQGIL